MPHLVKAAVRKQQELEEAEASGDLHYTQHGCHCLLEWSYEGETMKGCNRINTTFSHGWPWCKVTKACERFEGKVEAEELWDFCTLEEEVAHTRTRHGCHCAPRWEYKDKLWHSCSKTSLGPRWCYVFEGGNLCSEALRTEHHGQHWDHCFVEDDTMSILTRHGCHCMPEYDFGNKTYQGCAVQEGKDKPGCIVLEDEEACPGAAQVEGTNFAYDECHVLDSASEAGAQSFLSGLEAAGVDGCHCAPAWDHDGASYEGCGQTPGREGEWCYLAEDTRPCPVADGVGEQGRRWRYCGASGSESGSNSSAEIGGGEGGGANQTPSGAAAAPRVVNVIPVIVPVNPNSPSIMGGPAAGGEGGGGADATEESGAPARSALGAAPGVVAATALAVLGAICAAPPLA